MTAQKGNIAFLVLIAVAAIAAAGVLGYWWRQRQTATPTQPLPWEECVKIPNARIATSYPGVCYAPDGRNVVQPLSEGEKKNLQTPDETVNWKTYVSNTWRFSLKYPATWEVHEGQGGVSFSDPNLPFPSPAVGGVDIVQNWTIEQEKQSKIVKMEPQGTVINPGIYDIQDFQLAGVNGKSYKYTTQVGLSDQFITLTKDSVTYKIWYGLDSKDKDEFLELLKTFKFL